MASEQSAPLQPGDAAAMAAGPAAPAYESPWRLALRHFLRSRLAVAGLAAFLALCALALLAPWIAPQDPYDLTAINIMDGLLPPRSENPEGGVFWLGTDAQGRDIVSAILYGLRISLGVGVLSALAAACLGAAVGLFAAYAGGRTEAAIMRLVDLQLSFPTILVALMILAFLGKGVLNVVLALVIVEWANYARTARATMLVEKGKEYVEAAVCLAIPTWRIIFRQIMPNCLPPLLVIASLQVARAIMLEATLSYLGVGVPVTEPSLGLLIANGYQYMLSGKFWMCLYPGLALVLLVVSINLVGDRLRDVINPRRRA